MARSGPQRPTAASDAPAKKPAKKPAKEAAAPSTRGERKALAADKILKRPPAKPPAKRASRPKPPHTVPARRRQVTGRPSILDAGWHPHRGDWQPGSPAALTLNYIRGGATYSNASRRAGFAHETLNVIRRRGRQTIDTVATASDPFRMLPWPQFRLLIPYAERIYADFTETLDYTNAEVIANVEMEAHRDLPETPGMRRWWLAHRAPELWSEQATLNVTGRIEHDHRHAVLVGLLTNPELREAAMSLGEKVALHAPDAVLGAEDEPLDRSLRAVE